MPITETDLRVLLAERSLDQPPVTDRLDQVHRRIARRGHRRQFVGAVAAVVIVLAVAGVVAVPHWIGRSNPSSISGPDSADPPLYYRGGKLIASATLQSPQEGGTSLTFTPTDWHLSVFVKCTGPDGWFSPVWVEAIVNGHPAPSASCFGSGSSWTAGLDEDEAKWSSWGVELGKPSTLAISLSSSAAKGGSPSPLPQSQRPTGLVEVAVYQQVPIDQYVFPPRPAKLLPLSPTLPSYVELVLDSRENGANGSWTFPVKLSQFAGATAYVVAPGALAFSVAGKQVGVCDWWDYTSYDCGISLNPASLAHYGVTAHDGDTIEVTVTTSRFKDPAWLVTRIEHGPDQTAQPEAASGASGGTGIARPH